MTQREVEIVKSSVPVLKERGEELTRWFYAFMFENYPEVKPMFNMEKQADGRQPKALANSILLAAQNVENLEKMTDFVKKVGKTHVGLGVLPEHYPIVGACLLEAIKNVFGADEETLTAWGKAYEAIADFYIKIEKEIYASRESGAEK